MRNQNRINRYSQIIERIFLSRYKPGAKSVVFERRDIEQVAAELGIALPRNLGDVVYSFRYRAELPESVKSRAPTGREWVILPAGRSRYSFTAVPAACIVPSPMVAETKVPDATPGIISMYALNDEQALLAKLRYNRLVDVFTGAACYSLQNHLRTTVPDMGQVETDEVYVGVDRRGVHYVFPVQAKGGTDRLSIVQIAQDFAMCETKFPALVCKPIAAQFMGEIIVLFDFEKSDQGLAISSEKHYRLVPPSELSSDELAAYNSRLS